MFPGGRSRLEHLSALVARVPKRRYIICLPAYLRVGERLADGLVDLTALLVSSISCNVYKAQLIAGPSLFRGFPKRLFAKPRMSACKRWNSGASDRRAFARDSVLGRAVLYKPPKSTYMSESKKTRTQDLGTCKGVFSRILFRENACVSYQRGNPDYGLMGPSNHAPNDTCEW